MWRAFASKVMGSAHVTDGRPCQDAYNVRQLSTEVIAVAVADGAGSAECADQGSELAVRAALDCLGRIPDLVTSEDQWEALIRAAFTQAHERILDHAMEQGRPPRDYATTLQVALLAPHLVVYGRIGDGAAVVRRHAALALLGPPPDNTFVNETTFLTSPDASATITAVRDTIADCAVFTDGIQHLALRLADWAPHEKFFQPLFHFARRTEDQEAGTSKLAEFLAGEAVERRTDDDRTLVVAVWVENGLSGH